MTKEEKVVKIQEHRDYHKYTLEKLILIPSDFNVKSTFMNDGKRVVALYPSEFLKKNGFYFEFVDAYLEPTDPTRQLYKYGPDPHFEKFQLLTSGAYAVPVDSLTKINKVIKAPDGEVYDFGKLDSQFDIEKVGEDESINSMTIRDLASILWKKPVSAKNWLNDLIKKTYE